MKAAEIGREALQDCPDGPVTAACRPPCRAAGRIVLLAAARQNARLRARHGVPSWASSSAQIIATGDAEVREARAPAYLKLSDAFSRLRGARDPPAPRPCGFAQTATFPPSAESCTATFSRPSGIAPAALMRGLRRSGRGPLRHGIPGRTAATSPPPPVTQHRMLLRVHRGQASGALCMATVDRSRRTKQPSNRRFGGGVQSIKVCLHSIKVCWH